MKLHFFWKDKSMALPVADIESVSGSGNYTTVHANMKTYLLAKTLKRLCPELGPGFVRIHKAHAVNLAYVEKVYRDQLGFMVRMRSGATLPVARRRHNEVSQIQDHLKTVH